MGTGHPNLTRSRFPPSVPTPDPPSADGPFRIGSDEPKLSFRPVGSKGVPGRTGGSVDRLRLFGLW